MHRIENSKPGHRLNGYLASWVPSPPRERRFQTPCVAMPYASLHVLCFQTGQGNLVSLKPWAHCGCEGYDETGVGQGRAGQSEELREVTRRIPVRTSG